jgi:uncharacterized membrane protein SpoIIM required for sporulation
VAGVDEFILARQARWEALRSLIGRAGNDPRRLQAAEIEQLGRLYRQVTSDLAVARRDFPRDEVIDYLNGLASRAYPLVYRSPSGSWQQIRRFFLQDFAARYREAGWFIFAAFLLFALPAVASFLIVLADPELAEQVLPSELTRTVRDGRLWTDISPQERALAASTIATNNIRVSLLAFAGGILLGTLTVYILVLNGLLFGALLGYTHLYHLDLSLLAFVSSHGYLELTVVFIAGGAGLEMAWAPIHPGLLSRRDALVLAARRAVMLVVGAVPVLVVAGLIEGFVSPSHSVPDGAKFAIGMVTGLALHLWLSGPALRAHLWPRRRQRRLTRALA